ncbi:MAG: hypothetical protein KatS3mg059_0960 [Thermomicrobiales bacterium]|nr:MAG: hypothetical protein KatS3mg059_0960 [Thermomicrobiales bacterium]
MASPPLPGNILPTPLASFVGRERELEAICTLVRHGGIRLITLTGPGGVGKTRLAIRAAETLAPVFAGGVAFVSLAVITSPDAVAPAIAQALGIRETGSAPVAECLYTALHAKHLLLVLDNFEQVVAAAPLVAEMLAACPRLQVLVTSRALLRVSGEQVFPVPPLRLPDVEAPSHRVAEAEAVQLFVDRARAVAPGFALTKDNASAIAEVCASLDGLPLAIELAAARTQLLSPATLLSRLAPRLPLLTGGPRDQPDRLRTMRDAIAWSYDLLDESEQRLFRDLSVFSGGFTLAAAEAVAGQEPGTTHASTDSVVLNGIVSLMDKSLLRRLDLPDDASSTHASRFGMLETVREFAQEQREACGEAEAARAAHAAHFLALAEAVEAERIGFSPVRVAHRLGPERDNVRAALRWLREHGDIERGLRLASALWPLWLEHGDLSEGRAQLAALLALPDAAVHREAWAKAMWVAGALAQAQGDPLQAVIHSERALAACRELGDHRGAAAALYTLGLDAMVRGDYERAEGCLAESLTLFRAARDARAGSWALRHLGSVAYRHGDLDQAEAYATEGLALVQAAGSRLDVARLLHTLGIVVAHRGDLVLAIQLWEESLAHYRTVGDRWGVADALASLGDAARQRGDLLQAATLLHESLVLLRDIGDPEGTALVLGRLGWVARANGDLSEAARRFEEGLAVAREHDERAGLIWTLLGLGTVTLEQGDMAGAAALLLESLRLASDLEDQVASTAALERCAHLAAVAGQHVCAVRLLAAAGVLREVMGHPLFPADAADHWRLAATLRAALGVERFMAAWAEGRVMTREAAWSEAAQVANALSGSTRGDTGRGLTPREREVLQLLLAGSSDRDIAEALFISRPTASKHVQAILMKLGVRSRKAAIAKVLAEQPVPDAD